MKMKLFLLLGVLMLALCACSPKEPVSAPGNPVPPVSGEDGGIDALPAAPDPLEETKGKDEEPKEPAGPEVTPPDDPDDAKPDGGEGEKPPESGGGGYLKGEPFSYEEIKDIFLFAKGDILRIYGGADEEVTLDYMGEKGEGLRYGLTYFELDPSGYLHRARVADAKIPPPRGLSLGAPLKDIIASFSDKGEGESLPFDEMGEGYYYRMLYGEYGYMSAYAMVIYKGETPIGVLVADSWATALFELRDEALNAVTYSVLVI